MTPSNWIEIAKICGAVIAFWIGFWQYRKGLSWKRLEFVSAEMRIFYDDEAVKLAMSMLDWSRKKTPLFRYRDRENGEQVPVDYDLVASALEVAPEAKFDVYQTAIREIFERFLEFLARFEGFLAGWSC